MTDRHARVLVERGDAALEIGRRHQVVVRRPLEVATGRLLEDAVEVRRRADVVLVALVAEARIGGGDPTTDLLGRVGRGVVGDDRFEIGEGLGAQAVEQLREIRSAVVNGDAEGELRAGSGHP